MPPPPDVRPRLRLVHYWWPVLMGGSGALVVQRATQRPFDPAGLALLLFGILAAYSVDRLQDDVRARSSRLHVALRTGTVTGVVGTAVLLAQVPVRTAALVPVLSLIVLAYSRLKALPLLKTVLVAAAWTWSLTAFPFRDDSWLGLNAWMVPVTIPLTCLFASGCLLCDVKDLQTDRVESVSSLPVLIGTHRTIAAAILLAAIGAAFAMVQHRIGLSIGGAGLVVAAMRPSVLADDVVGPLLVDVMLTVPGLLIALRLV
jgi:hypothetical protein